MKKITCLLIIVGFTMAICSSCVSSRGNGCPTTNKNFFKGR
ncbi:MAG: hypothetical protein WCR66_04220 [Bacteroidota bacterium]